MMYISIILSLSLCALVFTLYDTLHAHGLPVEDWFDHLIARLPDGTQLRGYIRKGVANFKGIPYAEPPLGALRWSPPRAWNNPDTSVVIDAGHFGSFCVQDDFVTGSEDCLFLNVFAPASSLVVQNNDTQDGDDQINDYKEPLPVGIFIHGGGYSYCSADLYDASSLLEYLGDEIVIVTLNYRLGVFGFLGGDEIRSQDSVSGSSGNYGLQDQRLAMQWVQNNIAAFGGDPNRVMIFGESAGAGSVSNHLTMPKSYQAGLFHSAAMESGSFSQWVTQNMTLAQSGYDRLVVAAGCETAEGAASSSLELDCLLQKSADEILSAAAQVPSDYPSVYSSPWCPVADGVEIHTHPWIALSNGDVADVPILHGTNTDEGSMFTTLPENATYAELHAYWAWAGYSASERLRLDELYLLNHTYPDTASTSTATAYWWASQRSVGDSVMSCPAKHISQQLYALHTQKPGMGESQSKAADIANTGAGAGAAVWLYHFEHLAQHLQYVSHFSEVPFVFHFSSVMTAQQDKDMADVMATYWGRFLSAGNPNIAGGTNFNDKELPQWPAYSSDMDNAIALRSSDDVDIITGLNHEECDFFIPRIDAQIRAGFAVE